MRLATAALTALILAAVLAGCAGPTPVPTDPASAPAGPATTLAPAALGLLYTCGVVPFDPTILDQRGDAEKGQDPAAAALRELLASESVDPDLPMARWTFVGGNPDFAEYVARHADGYAFASVRQRNGRWEPESSGGCAPIAAVEGASIAIWTFSLDVPQPDAGSTTFTADVIERACTGGQAMGDRLLPPMIRYGAATVVVVFAARPLPGDHDCPGNPSTAVVVELREPLGDRDLLDGALWPPRDPEAPIQ